ncbi:dihydrofolate reductase [Robiginitalea sp. M366]|uniref:dihydrofolate reductase n=1 Tax=Robiginitalea aestuariiviva TaxID=3036903 RepID=UPI00240DDB9A|nr:dihydrofolate reductase [Robiginitalea aestuariiviva]MDG1570935.1 dihydrofolate reductase [Robiginitalea aestuariiviva]
MGEKQRGALILIAAAGQANELGKEGELPWHLPDDFRRFKALTTGHPMIMGRKTFETFPKPLPNRRHIIITRREDYRADHPDCEVVHSLDAALEATAKAEKRFVIGGGEIYALALPQATEIELTRVHGTFEADTRFPEIDPDLWTLKKATYHPTDGRHKHAFTYQTFSRKP